MARISLLVALAGAALGAGPASSAQAAECSGDARVRDVRVQLWMERGCEGAWIEVSFGGDGDRADFRSFEHSDGDDYDVDDNRSSAAVAPGTCVRFFYDTGFRRPATGLRCARQHDLTLALPEGVSSMRACTRWTHSLCRGVSGSLRPPAPRRAARAADRALRLRPARRLSRRAAPAPPCPERARSPA